MRFIKAFFPIVLLSQSPLHASPQSKANSDHPLELVETSYTVSPLDYFNTHKDTLTDKEFSEFYLPQTDGHVPLDHFLTVTTAFIISQGDRELMTDGWNAIFEGWAQYHKATASGQKVRKKPRVELKHERCLLQDLIFQYRDHINEATPIAEDDMSPPQMQHDRIAFSLVTSRTHRHFLKTLTSDLYDVLRDQNFISEKDAAADETYSLPNTNK